MNFGKRGLQKKINNLESNSAQIGRWAGVTSIRLILIVVLAAVILAACLLIGAYRGIIAGTPLKNLALWVTTDPVSPSPLVTALTSLWLS